MDLHKKMEQYADIVINKCINLQSGEAVLIEAQIEHIDMVKLLVKSCYKAGASEINLVWDDDVIQRETLLMAPDHVLDSFPEWQKKLYMDFLDKKGAFIKLYSPSGKVAEGVPSDRIARSVKARTEALLPFLNATRGMKIKWNVIGVPTKEWACTVFPELDGEAAKEMLWQKIIQCCRLDSDNPEKAFDLHVDTLISRAQQLRNKQYVQLIYKGPGTDLKVDLPKGHIWHPSLLKRPDGSVQMINFPTEEIATLPHKYGVDGRLQATMPLIFNGRIVKDFWFKFKDGKIIDFDAVEGRDVLEQILSIDDNAKYLGEVSFVSQDTPIAQDGTLFYNTLFDENASCHFAIGAAYPATLAGSEGKTPEQLDDMGLNVSKTHVDFMVGSDQLDIKGVLEDGSQEYIMKCGLFVNHQDEKPIL